MSDVALPRVAEPPRKTLAEWIRQAYYLGIREIKLALRTPAYLVPNLIMPALFFFILVGSFSTFGEVSGYDYGSFALPVSVVFAVTGGSAGLNLVMDIESGYFDKLLLTPTSRLALLVGAMGADFLRIVLQGVFIIAIALLMGTPVETGYGGLVVLLGIASIWGLAYSAIGFALALKTGNSQVVGSMWAFQFPFLFLAPTFAQLEDLQGWLAAAAKFNPLTYLLEGLRSLTMEGWNAGELLIALGISVGFGVITLTFAFRALLGRVR